MDNFNKMFSFILGLIVVVVFLAVFTKRLNIGQNISKLTGKKTTKTTITPTTSSPVSKGNIKYKLTPQPTKTIKKTDYDESKTTANNYQKAKSIPATGSPTLLLLFAGANLVGGIYLRKKK